MTTRSISLHVLPVYHVISLQVELVVFVNHIVRGQGFLYCNKIKCTLILLNCFYCFPSSVDIIFVFVQHEKSSIVSMDLMIKQLIISKLFFCLQLLVYSPRSLSQCGRSLARLMRRLLRVQRSTRRTGRRPRCGRRSMPCRRPWRRRVSLTPARALRPTPPPAMCRPRLSFLHNSQVGTPYYVTINSNRFVEMIVDLI